MESNSTFAVNASSVAEAETEAAELCSGLEEGVCVSWFQGSGDVDRRKFDQRFGKDLQEIKDHS